MGPLKQYNALRQRVKAANFQTETPPKTNACFDLVSSDSSSIGSRVTSKPALERFPITWNHVIEKESLKFKGLEHVGIEKGEQLFREVL
jgi:hypothetical protein